MLIIKKAATADRIPELQFYIELLFSCIDVRFLCTFHQVHSQAIKCYYTLTSVHLSPQINNDRGGQFFFYREVKFVNIHFCSNKNSARTINKHTNNNDLLEKDGGTKNCICKD